MTEDDEFGDLYSDLSPAPHALCEPASRSGFLEDDDATLIVRQGSGLPGITSTHSFYDEEADDDEGEAAHLQKELVRKPAVDFSSGDEDSEQDELQLGAKGAKDQLKSSVIRKNLLGTTENGRFHIQADGGVVGAAQHVEGSVESEGPEAVVANGGSSLELGDAKAPRIQSSKEPLDMSLPGTCRSPRNLESNLGAENITNHIPGLSTTSKPAQFGAEDELHGDGRDAVGHDITAGGVVSFGGGEDVDSDSEDDLRIVLNGGHPFFERGAAVAGEQDSEDEDGEDFVVLAGVETVDDREWGEEPSMPVEGAQGLLAADKLLPVGGEKPGGAGDERGLNAKGAGLHPGPSRIGYGGHAYHSSYRYVRPGALGGGVATSDVQDLSSRVPLVKSGNGRGDWSGTGRGFSSSPKMPLPPWGTSGPRGFQYGFEFNLPSNKTVFDLDLDSFEDKPWRHPNVDASDYFNFGFNESSWKDYCKQLAQLRLESTLQSKIRVYESLRSEQEFDPELPPELVAVAGLPRACGESAQHRQAGKTVISVAATGSGRGVGRGYMHVNPIARAIQVEGGGGERRPSADIRRQRLRESDAIILIDAPEDLSGKEQSGDDNIQMEEDDEIKALPDLNFKNKFDKWGETGPLLGNRVSILKRPNLASRSLRSSSAFVQGKPAAGSELLPGESFSPPSATRHKTPRPLTPPTRKPIQDKRETDKGQNHSSGVHEESKSGKEDRKNEKSHAGSAEREEKVEFSHCYGKSPDNDDACKVIGLDERTTASRREDIAKGNVPSNSLRTSKRRRLGSHKETGPLRHDDNKRRKRSSKGITLRKDLNSQEQPKKVNLGEGETDSRQQTRHDDNFLDPEPQPEQRSGSVGHQGKKLDRQATSHMVKNHEQKTKVKDKLRSNKAKDKELDRHCRASDAQRKKKEVGNEAKKDNLSEGRAKQKERGLMLDLLDVERRHDDGSRRDRLNMDQWVREKPTNCFLSADEYNFHRAEEDTRRRNQQGQGNIGYEHPKTEKMGEELCEREWESRESREAISRKDKPDDHRHHRGREEKERENAHQWKGLREEARHLLMPRIRKLSHDRALVGTSREGKLGRENLPITTVEQEHIKERNKHSGFQEQDRDHIEDHLHQPKTSRGWFVTDQGQPCIDARSADEQRHHIRPSLDSSNARDIALLVQLDDRKHDDQGHKAAAKEHNLGSYQLCNHLGKAPNSRSSDTTNFRVGTETHGGHRDVDLETLRSPENHSEVQCLLDKVDSPKVMVSGTTQDAPQDVRKKRGRSKLERWTNRRVIEADSSHKITIISKKLKKKERRRGNRHKGSSKHLQGIIPPSSGGQVSNGIDGSTLQATKSTDGKINLTSKLSDVAGKTEEHSRNQNGTETGTVQEDVKIGNSGGRQHVQQPLKMQQLELAAKLEKRRERFKLPILEERELTRRLSNDANQLLGKVEVKPERPARKRRWGSS